MSGSGYWLFTHSGSGRWEELPEAEKMVWKDRAKQFRVSAEYRRQQEEKRERRLLERRVQQETDQETPRKKTTKRQDTTNEQYVKQAQDLPFFDDSNKKQFEKKRQSDRTELKSHFEWNAPCLPNAGDDERRLSWARGQQFFILAAVPYLQLQQGENEEPTYPPCELALLQLTMDEGVQGVWCWRIAHQLTAHTVQLHLKEAQEYETNPVTGHGIPFVNQTEQMMDKYHLVADYNVVLKGLQAKTRGNKFIFVYSAHFNQVVGAIRWLKSHAKQPSHNYSNLHERQLVCVEDLAAQLADYAKFEVVQQEIENCCNLETWSTGDADVSKMRCEFHAALGRHNCAEAIVRKMAYFLFDFLCDKLDFDITLDRHIPLAIGDVASAITVEQTNSRMNANKSCTDDLQHTLTGDVAKTDNADDTRSSDEVFIGECFDSDEFDIENEMASLRVEVDGGQMQRDEYTVTPPDVDRQCSSIQHKSAFY